MLLRIDKIIWSEKNVLHIAKHEINSTDVEEVLHRKVLVKKSYRERIVIVGETKKGKFVSIIAHEDEPGVYYIITARDSDQGEKDEYAKEN